MEEFKEVGCCLHWNLESIMSFLSLSAVRIYLKMGGNSALTWMFTAPILNYVVNTLVFYILRDIDDNNNDDDVVIILHI